MTSSPVIFDLRLPSQDIVVLTQEEDVIQSDTNKYCLFGTSTHVAGLETELQQVNAAIETSTFETERLVKRKERLEKQLLFLSEQDRINEEVQEEDKGIEFGTNQVPAPEEDELHVTSEHFGKLVNFRVLDHAHGTRLFQKPRIRQYFIGGVEKHERKVGWDELFFDLIFVAVISSLDHSFKVAINFDVFWNFFRLFYPVWSVWHGTSGIANRFGSDDFGSKLFLLINTAFVVGMGIYSGSAFAIESSTWVPFIGFFMASRLTHFLGASFHALFFRKFRKQIVFNALANFLSSVPFFISCFFADINIRNALYWFGFSIDCLTFFGSVLFVRYVVNAKYRVALNIEHWSERLGLFTLLVLGEMVVALISYNSKLASLSVLYLASFFGLVIAVSFQWIYFDVDASRQFLHALRRSAFSGLSWSFLHFPLHLFLICCSAGLSLLISKVGKEQDGISVSGVTLAERMLFLGSLSMSLFLISLIGITHKSMDKHHGFTPNLPKSFRISSRMVVAIVFLILTFSLPEDALTPLFIVAIGAIGMAYQALMEEYGRLEKITKE